MSRRSTGKSAVVRSAKSLLPGLRDPWAEEFFVEREETDDASWLSASMDISMSMLI
jgi:hypothetical protein